MITLLVGENSFELERKAQQIVAAFDGEAEKIDGTQMQLTRLPDVLMGGTLFANKRLVIIKNVSENKAIWMVFDEWINRISDDVHLVLIEPKPDKRTKTYKAIHKKAEFYEANVWTERDSLKAEKWASEEAAGLGFSLDKKSAHMLVERVGVDQWALYWALEKLAVLGDITPRVIEEHIEANSTESVFGVFEAALKGETLRLKQMLATLGMSEDAYRLFGLLAGQAFQFAVLSVADASPTEVAKDIGVHPFALSKLAPFVKERSDRQVRQIIEVFAEADNSMKTSAADPWLLIERALIKVASQ